MLMTIVSTSRQSRTNMSFIKAFLFLAVVVVAAYAEEAPRVKKQILVGAYDDGSYWPGKYDVRELSPVLGALPDGAAVRTAIPAAIPAALPGVLSGVLPGALPTLAAHYPYLI